MLKINNISKSFRKHDKSLVTAIKNISLEVKSGEFQLVQGPSGCGKSTLLFAAGILLKPDHGSVFIDHNDTYGMDKNQQAFFRAKNIGFVFQQFHLLPYLNARENILAAHIPLKGSAMNQKDQCIRLEGLLEKLGITHCADQKPYQLSIGEQQRVAVARALFNQPKIILADEPTGNLDKENALIVLDFLSDFALQGGAVLMVTHSEYPVRGVSNIIKINQGHLVSD
ncbi:MAG: ABC transporter ATP-binding protein [Spirochaetales bacterium]|nr:ABC transporter ATP-binding protein [Spirochaetales bacterium]